MGLPPVAQAVSPVPDGVKKSAPEESQAAAAGAITHGGTTGAAATQPSGVASSQPAPGAGTAAEARMPAGRKEDGGGVVFVCGCGRSGTTLLADLLNLHSVLAGLWETEFITPLANLVRRPPAKQDSRKIQSEVLKIMTDNNPMVYGSGDKAKNELYFHDSEHLRGHYWGSDPVGMRSAMMKLSNDFGKRVQSRTMPAAQALGHFMDAMFEKHRSAERKPIVFNKTPSYAEAGVLDLLACELYPESKVIHCVRNPYSVAQSYLENTKFGPRTLRAAADFWLKRTRNMLEWQARNPGRCLEVCYENLLLSPTVELQRICRFLGVPDEVPGMLRAYGEWRFLPRPQAHSYLSKYTEGDRSYFESTVGPLSRQYCYREGGSGARFYISGLDSLNFEPMDGDGDSNHEKTAMARDTLNFQILEELKWSRAVHPAGGGSPGAAPSSLTFNASTNCWSFSVPTVMPLMVRVRLAMSSSDVGALHVWLSAAGDESFTGHHSADVVLCPPPPSIPSAVPFRCVTPACPYLMSDSEMRYRIHGLCCGGCPEGLHGSRCARVSGLGFPRASKEWHTNYCCPTPNCPYRIHSVPNLSRWPAEANINDEFRWYCCTLCGDSAGAHHAASCELLLAKAPQSMKKHTRR